MTLGAAALLLLSPIAASPAAPGELLAIKVGKAETVSHGTLEVLARRGNHASVGFRLLADAGRLEDLLLEHMEEASLGDR